MKTFKQSHGQILGMIGMSLILFALYQWRAALGPYENPTPELRTLQRNVIFNSQLLFGSGMVVVGSGVILMVLEISRAKRNGQTD